MLIEKRVNLKRIQNLMGHEDVKTTLYVYGHLIEKAESLTEPRIGMIQRLAEKPCDESVASARKGAEVSHFYMACHAGARGFESHLSRHLYFNDLASLFDTKTALRGHFCHKVGVFCNP